MWEFMLRLEGPALFDDLNTQPPSSKKPHFQNEARYTTFLVKMSFICMRMKNDSQMANYSVIPVMHYLNETVSEED